MVFQESQLSAFWFHHPESMCCAQPEVTILHLSGAPGPVENIRDTYQITTHIPWGVTRILRYYFLSSFPSFCIPSLPSLVTV